MAADFKQFLRDTHQKLKSFKGRVDALKKQPEDEHVLPPPPPERKIDKLEVVISGKTVFKIVAITILLLLLTQFLGQISDILVIFFVSLLFAAALDPIVDRLERRRVPRSVGVILIYLGVLLVLTLIISNVLPILATELAQIANKVQDFISSLVKGDITLPSYLEKYRPTILNMFEGIDVSQTAVYKEFLLQIANRLSDVAGNVFSVLIVAFNGFLNTILVLVITFLMTVDETGIDRFILSLFPERHGHYIRAKSRAIKEKMGSWLRGQIILCFIVGILVYIGLFIVGLITQKVEYSATIAIVAGLTELIPYAGPFIAWIVALPIVANQSLPLILWVTGLMYVVQVLENNLIVPIVMNKAVGISPIFIMFSMFVGFEFLGVLGMVLSVPVATAISLFVSDYAEKEK